MRKRWFLVGMMFLLVPWLLVGCGVAQEVYDAAVAERDSLVANLQSVQSELDAAKSKLQLVQSELDKSKLELESVSGELESVSGELESVKSELDPMTSKLQSAKSEFDAAKSELRSVQSELSATQSTIKTQEQTMAKAQTFAEVLSVIFVPALTGEPVNEIELLAEWMGNIQAAEDAELQRLFFAALSSGGGESELIDFFIYVFETLPKLLE